MDAERIELPTFRNQELPNSEFDILQNGRYTPKPSAQFLMEGTYVFRPLRADSLWQAVPHCTMVQSCPEFSTMEVRSVVAFSVDDIFWNDFILI